MGKIIKNKFQINTLISEDIISYNYSGNILSTGVKVLIKKYKTSEIPKEYIYDTLDKLKVLKLIVHPNLVKVIDYEYIEGRLFVVYEAHEGKPLSELLQKNYLSRDKIIYLLGKIQKGLNGLYEHNLYHGSLNPDNIIILKNGQIKIIDYVVNDEINLFYLKNDHLIENVMFYAPEQLKRGITTRTSDIYALGAIIYLLLTGKLPFKNKYNIKKLLKEKRKGVIPPRKISADIPRNLSSLIVQMLSVDKASRIKNIDSIIEIYKHPGIDKDYEENKGNLKELEEGEVKFADREKYYKSSMLKKVAVFLLITVIMGGGLAFVYSLYLNYFSSLPEVRIPNVKNVPKSQAMEMLEEKKLKPVIGGHRENDAVSANSVIFTIPEMGRVVKVDRIVRLFVSSGEAKKNVPNLIGMKYREAFNYLNSLELVPTVNKRIYSNTFPRGTVVKQEPVPNSSVTANGEVALTVSEGYPVEIKVSELPNASGRDLVLTRIKFAIAEGWGENKIKLEVKSSGNAEVIYEEMHKPGDIMMLEFEEYKTSEVIMYFNGARAFSANLSSYL